MGTFKKPNKNWRNPTKNCIDRNWTIKTCLLREVVCSSRSQFRSAANCTGLPLRISEVPVFLCHLVQTTYQLTAHVRPNTCQNTSHSLNTPNEIFAQATANILCIKYVSTTSVCYCHKDIIIDYMFRLSCSHHQVYTGEHKNNTEFARTYGIPWRLQIYRVIGLIKTERRNI